MLKWIQTHEDAYTASLHTPQVKGIILSNHRGRAVDTAPPSVHTLLEIRKFCPEVLDELEVVVDGVGTWQVERVLQSKGRPFIKVPL